MPDVAKVLDFGLVKDQTISGTAGLTQSNTILGTPLSMAPEALTTPERVGPRTDLYALGAVGYRLLTGVPVFTGQTAAASAARRSPGSGTVPTDARLHPAPTPATDLLPAKVDTSAP